MFCPYSNICSSRTGRNILQNAMSVQCQSSSHVETAPPVQKTLAPSFIGVQSVIRRDVARCRTGGSPNHIDGEKGVLLTLEIMTMKKMFKHVYNTWLWNISPDLGAQRFLLMFLFRTQFWTYSLPHRSNSSQRMQTEKPPPFSTPDSLGIQVSKRRGFTSDV